MRIHFLFPTSFIYIYRLLTGYLQVIRLRFQKQFFQKVSFIFTDAFNQFLLTGHSFEVSKFAQGFERGKNIFSTIFLYTGVRK